MIWVTALGLTVVDLSLCWMASGPLECSVNIAAYWWWWWV